MSLRKISRTIVCLFCLPTVLVAQTIDLNKIDKLLVKVKKNLYASKYEVSNATYNLFVADIKKAGNTDKYNVCAVDSMKWANKKMYNEPYVNYYHNHIAYKDYPVVNVNYAGATFFCEWLTEKYNNNAKRKFKKVRFKLPTEAEWIYAAKGGLDSVIFPWRDNALINKKGEVLSHFFKINDACIKINESRKIELNDSSTWVKYLDIRDWAGDITAPVNSYWPNGYGLYNVCGNVAEMLFEKGRTKGGSWASSGYYLRFDAEDEYKGFTEPSPKIGFRFFMEVVEE